MSTVNPSLIIEQQLEKLQLKSERGTLTYDEIKALEALVKLQIVLRLKASASKGDEDPFADMSSEELRALLPLLGDK